MIHIRPVTEADAQEIAALLNAIIAERSLTAMDRTVTPEEQHAFIRTFPPAGIFQAATGPDGRILAVQDVVPADRPGEPIGLGEISTFVRLDRRGSGIGRALCEATFREAPGQGFTTIRATVRADNAPAIAFYRGRGFRPLAVLRHYARIDGRDLDGVLLERPV